MTPLNPPFNPECILSVIWAIDAAQRNVDGEDNADECYAASVYEDVDSSDLTFTACTAAYTAFRATHPGPASVDARREAAAWWLARAYWLLDRAGV